MATFGMLDLRDTRVQQLRLADLGEDRLNEWIANELAIYNAIADELLSKLTFSTTEVQTRYGRQGSMRMLPAEEYSRMDLQRIGQGYSLGFPLKRFQLAIGWTRDFFRRKAASDLTAVLDAALVADWQRVIYEVKVALFGAVNYTFADEFKGDLAVKRLINADSTPIPSWDGATFNGASHTHYLFSTGTTFAQADATAIQNHLTEHGHLTNLVTYINSAEVAEWRAMTGFVPAQSPFVIDPLGTYARVSNPADLQVLGRNGLMEIRVRNWMPAGYSFSFAEYGPNNPRNPLARRLSDLPEDNNFHVVGTDDRYPFHSEYSERFIGFGAYNRTNGVVMYKDTGNGDAYVVPTITEP